MSVEYYHGDIFKAPIKILAQSCNAQCIQGAGMALSIRKRFPEVYEDDLTTVVGDKSKMGKVRFIDISARKTQILWVASMYTQFNYGRDRRQVSYEAFYRALERLRVFATETKLVIGLPYMISCQNAGGSWTVIEAMIKDVFDKGPEVLICKYLKM